MELMRSSLGTFPIALAAIVMCQVGLVLALRSRHSSILRISPLFNGLVVAGICAEILLLALLAYAEPLQSVFKTASLGLREWAFAALGIPLMIVAEEVRKLVRRRRPRVTISGWRRSQETSACASSSEG